MIWTQNSDINTDTIAQQPKEADECGVRFFLLSFIQSVAKQQPMLIFFLPVYNWYSLGVLWALWIIVNYIFDKKYTTNYDPIKNKFIMAISIFLQRHFYTRTPTKKELDVAQFALAQLITAVKTRRVASSTNLY